MAVQSSGEAGMPMKRRWMPSATIGAVLLAAICGAVLPVSTGTRAFAVDARAFAVDARGLTVSAYRVARTSSGHAPRHLHAGDTAHLRYISASGSLLFEQGQATGTLPGSMRAHINVGASLSGSFTIDTAHGSIDGHGAATPHGSGAIESFAGSLTVTGGSGLYVHAHGRAQLYGT